MVEILEGISPKNEFVDDEGTYLALGGLGGWGVG